MAYGSQTLNRAYSVSSVEGVDLRLHDKFKATAKVTLPLQYKHKDPSFLNNTPEYDFHAEDNFLQWLDGVRRVESEREEKKKQQQLGAEAAEAALQREETVPEGSKPANSGFGMQNSIPQRPPLHPVAASLGNEILQPVPLANNISQPASNSQVSGSDNWADFEGRALDPFELTELATINDMEELRSVLANSNPVVPMEVATDQVQQSSPPPMDTQTQEPTFPTDTANATVTDDGHQVHMETAQNQVSFRPNQPNQMDSGQSVQDLPPKYQPRKSAQPSLPHRTANTSPSSVSPLPPVRAGSFVGRSPLPPIGPSRENSQTSLISQDISFSQGRNSPPPSYSSIDPSHQPTTSGYNSSVDPPPNYPMDEVLDANFFPGSLNRYTPLPHSSPEPSTIGVTPADPTYEAMTVEEKNFVNTIVGMGFPKGRTARAVKNVGNDDRQVVDLLCAVDSLCGQGFPEEKVEVALSLQDNNQEKAQTFLSLWQRFEELGFKSEDIKRELVVHGNDEEKVLDTLTR